MAAKRAKKPKPSPYVVGSLNGVAEFFGIAISTVHRWAAQSGWPCAKPGRGRAGKYDLAAIAKWRESDRQKLSDDEAVISGPDSPALERWREAKAEREQIALARDKGLVISLDEADRIFDAVADGIRRGLDNLGRRFGQDSIDLIQQGLDEARRSYKSGSESVRR
jgi:phage terminase Nu1 subunit (DNA packaging protein)